MPDDRLRYLLRTSRPRFWLYLAGPVAVGVVYGARSTAALFTPATLALFAYFLLPANVLLYGVNDVFDADVDAENPKKETREVRYGGDSLIPAAVALCGALVALPLALVPRVAWLWIGGFLVLGVAYSAPPLRLKTRPPLDSLSNGLYVLPGAAAYAAVAGSHPPVLAVGGGWLWSMAMHTFSAIPDIEPDRRAGIETTATRLGERRTYAYCAACWTLAAVAFGLLDPRLGLLLGLYPVAVALVAGTSVDVSRAYWWYPAVNTAVGAVLTMGGLWRLAHG
ncbi:prenyltransferase [Haloplanus halophilus]|uniref:prenyltransferase n=1 Tax=Haloplanus halophilus TaxID=2949993 RepID=UPI00203E7F93|nr:prenyltransferase [Haloplanus sp. GDY1]